MAQTFTAATMGNAANDGNGNPIRTGGLKIAADLGELYSKETANAATRDAYENSYRCGISIAVTTGSNTIDFSTPFIDAFYLLEIKDPTGIVTSLTSQDQDGFVVVVSGNGVIHYIANYVK